MAGGRALGLALRGVRWRRASSLIVWLVAVACVAIGAGGIEYTSSARDAVVQGAIRRAPVDSSGTGVSISRAAGSKATTVSLAQKTARAFARLGDVFHPEIMSIQGTGHAVTASNHLIATVPIVYRQDACRHLVVVHGSCVDEKDPGGVMISAASAAVRGWHVGTTVTFSDFGVARVQSLVVRGIYDPVDPDGGYWFGNAHQYFVQNTALARYGVPQTDAMLVTASAWKRATVNPHNVTDVYADLALDPDHLHIEDVGAFNAQIGQVLDDAGPGADAASASDAVVTAVPDIVAQATSAADSVSIPIGVTAAQLLLLAWAVLFLVMISASESRSAEIALGKLRGLTPRETVLHAVLEPALLLLAAIPAGVLLAHLALVGVGRRVLGDGTEIAITGWTWLAGVGAALGGLVAASFAGVTVLRRSVLEQWRRTERRPGRSGWVVDAVVATVAVIGFVELVTTAPRSGGAAFLPALAPGLLAVTAALLVGRALPWAGRAAFRATRGTRHVAWFVAVRQVARRQGDMRVFALLTVAVALVVFGVTSRSVFDRNRLDRARTEIGANRVLLIRSGAANATAAVDRVDPTGRWAVAVHQESLTLGNTVGSYGVKASPTPPTLLVVDPVRFARVAYWRSDFGPAPSLNDALRPLRAVAPVAPHFDGTSLRVTVQATVKLGGPLTLQLGLTTSTGTAITVPVGAISGTRADTIRTVQVSAAVPNCAAGCALRRISIVGGPASTLPVIASVAFRSLDAVGANGSATSLLASMNTAVWTSINPPGTDTHHVEALTTKQSVTLTLRTSDQPADSTLGYGVYASVPLVIPAVATANQLDGGDLQVVPSDGDAFVVRPSKVRVLPRAGDAGMVISSSWLIAAKPSGSTTFAPNQIWLGADAPADAVARLAAAGVTVGTVQSVGTRSAILARQGPSFAVAMLRLGAIAAALLAVAGAATTLFVASRRRLYELAAMRSLGVRARRLLAALVLEQLLVTVVAALIGGLAGAIGARIALARLPEFADRPVFPPQLTDVPVLLVIGVCVVVVIVVVAVAAAGGSVLVRRAAPSRLREAQQ